MAKRRSDAMNASCVRPNRSASMATLSMHLRRGVVAICARGLGVEVEEAQLLPVIGDEERRGQQVEAVGAGPAVGILGADRGGPERG